MDEGASFHWSVEYDILSSDRERESDRDKRGKKMTFKSGRGTVKISFGQMLSPAGVSHMSVFGPLCFAVTTQEHLKGEESLRMFWFFTMNYNPTTAYVCL